MQRFFRMMLVLACFITAEVAQAQAARYVGAWLLDGGAANRQHALVISQDGEQLRVRFGQMQPEPRLGPAEATLAADGVLTIKSNAGTVVVLTVADDRTLVGRFVPVSGRESAARASQDVRRDGSEPDIDAGDSSRCIAAAPVDRLLVQGRCRSDSVRKEVEAASRSRRQRHCLGPARGRQLVRPQPDTQHGGCRQLVGQRQRRTCASSGEETRSMCACSWPRTASPTRRTTSRSRGPHFTRFRSSSRTQAAASGRERSTWRVRWGPI